MNTTRHTPGPWQSWQTGFDNQTFALGPNGKTPIAKTLGGNPELNQANARLIAASPSLLDFAEQVARSACLQQKLSGVCFCYSCEAKKLVAQATGVEVQS